jgi:hypothetical protein
MTLFTFKSVTHLYGNGSFKTIKCRNNNLLNGSKTVLVISMSKAIQTALKRQSIQYLTSAAFPIKVESAS